MLIQNTGSSLSYRPTRQRPLNGQRLSDRAASVVYSTWWNLCESCRVAGPAFCLVTLSWLDPSLVEEVYKSLSQAAIDPSRWPAAASAAMNFMGSSDVHIFSVNKKTGTNKDLILRAPEVKNDWGYILKKCEVLNYIMNNPNYVQFTDYDVLPESEIKKSEFYQWAKEYDAKYRIVLRLIDSTSIDAGIGFLRPESLGHATKRDLERLQLIAPQLRLAAQVSHHLTGSTLHLERLVESLETARTAAVVLSGTGRVAFANRRARSILELGDGVGCSNGELALTTPSARDRFIRLLAGAANASLTGDTRRPGGRVAVRRPSGMPPYQLLVAGLPPTDPFLDIRKPWVLALIIDPSVAERPTVEVLRQGYRLTPMEADIAARFASGEALGMIAEGRGVTLGTLRTQFKSVMAKMGVRRQAELMRLLTMFSRA